MKFIEVTVIGSPFDGVFSNPIKMMINSDDISRIEPTRKEDGIEISTMLRFRIWQNSVYVTESYEDLKNAIYRCI